MADHYYDPSVYLLSESTDEDAGDDDDDDGNDSTEAKKQAKEKADKAKATHESPAKYPHKSAMKPPKEPAPETKMEPAISDSPRSDSPRRDSPALSQSPVPHQSPARHVTIHVDETKDEPPSKDEEIMKSGSPEPIAPAEPDQMEPDNKTLQTKPKQEPRQLTPEPKVDPKSAPKSDKEREMEEYKAKLAEKRKLAREKAEREAEIERLRHEELQRQEEERRCLDEERHRREEEEALRLAEEARHVEELRLQRAIEQEERRRHDEMERQERERKAGVHMPAGNFRSALYVVQPPDRGMIELSNRHEPPPSLADIQPPVGPSAGMKKSESTAKPAYSTLHQQSICHQTSSEMNLREEVQMLLDEDPDLDMDHADMLKATCARNGDAHRAQILLDDMDSRHAKWTLTNGKDNFGLTPLHYAAQYNHLNVIKLLYDTHADMDSKDKKERTPLHYASMFKRESKRHKTDTDDDTLVPTYGMPKSDTAEDLQTKRKGKKKKEKRKTQMSAINILISKGATITVSDLNGQTPLHYAAMRGNEVATGELLSSGTVSLGMMTDKDIDGNTCLSLSVKNSHYEVVKLILEKHMELSSGDETDSETEDDEREEVDLTKNGAKGADVNTPNNIDMYPLHLAAINGEVRIVRLLVEHNARIDVYNNEQTTPLHMAAQYNHVDCVEFLVDKEADIECKDEKNRTPLLLACVFGHAPTVDMLIKKGADIAAVDRKHTTAIFLAAKKNQLSALEALLKYEGVKSMINDINDSGNAPLHVAALKGYLPIVRALLKNGANLDSENIAMQTPLHLAGSNGQTNIVRELLKQDKTTVNDQDEDSNTALHLAAIHGDAKSAGVLIEMGADIAARNRFKRTPLACASSKGSVETVKVLLEAGSQINTIADDKLTPLLWASMLGHTSVVEILIGRGADVEYRGRCLRNCLDLAIDNDNQATAEAIIQSKYWKEALRNHTYTFTWSRSHVLTTPMRKLIRKMPDVAESVFNRCMVDNKQQLETYNVENVNYVDDKNYEVEFNYEFLDDMYSILNWAEKGSSDSGLSSGPLADETVHQRNDTSTSCCSPMIPQSDTPLPTIDAPLDTMLDTAQGTLLPPLNHGAQKYEDKDCSLTNEEFTSFLHPEEVEHMKDIVVLETIEDIDKDKDGHISLEEYIGRHTDRPYTTDSGEFKENHPLMIMVTSKREDLLAHPLVTALLRHKWNKFGRTFYYLHFIMYVVFLVFMTGYMLSTDPPYGQATSCNDADTADIKQNWFARIGKYVIMTLVALNLLIEVLQICLAKLNYFSWENLTDWITYITALLTVIDVESCQQSTGFRTEWQWKVGTVAIFLTWINLVLFMQRFQRFGIYVVMFQRILKTYLQFVMIFVWFIVAFAMAFYALLQNQPAFGTIWQTLIKTTVMMIGEFDYTDIFIDGHVNYKTVSYIMFVIFMVIMSTIFMSLLVGLAVDNIKDVKEQAEFTRKAMLVEMALDVEKMLVPSRFIRRLCSQSKWVPDFIRRLVNQKPDTIQPNVGVNTFRSKTFGLESYGLTATNINEALNPELDEIEKVQESQVKLKKSVDKMKKSGDKMKFNQKEMKAMMKVLLESKDIRWQDEDFEESEESE